MKPDVAVFSRTDPVKKPDLWACFRRSARGFATVQVDDAHSIIGKHAPRYLERKGYLVKDCLVDGDFYSLTEAGKEWLTRGILSYAKNHPSERAAIKFFPEESTPVRRVRRRS